VSFAEVANDWSLDHLYDAHDVIEVLDELEAKRHASDKE